MKRLLTFDNLYSFLLICFVVSLCIFHGKVFSIGYLRGSPSDFLTRQLFLADIILVVMIFVFLKYEAKFKADFIVLILLAIATWSIIPRGLNYNFYAAALILLGLSCFYIFYHVKNREPIYITTSILGAIESIIGIIQFHLKQSIGLHIIGEPILSTTIDGIAKIDLPNGLKVIRAYGTFSHPNSLGAFLVIALAFTTYLILKRAKPYYYLNLFLIIIGITVTFSRAAILGAIILVIGIALSRFWIKFSEKRLFWRYCLIIGVGMVVSFVSYGTYLSTRATIEDNSTALRLQYDKDGIIIGERHAIFGVGFGNVIYAMNRIIPISQPTWEVEPPHNYLIIVSDETGIIGLILFLALPIYIFNSYYQRFDNIQVTRDITELVILLWLLIALLTLMQFDHYFYDIPLMALLFWMTLGIISGAANTEII